MGWDPGVPRAAGGGESWGGWLSPATRKSKRPHPRWAGTRELSLLSSPRRLQGLVLGRERGKERRGDWGNFPASLSGSINHRSRGGGRAGKCAEPERSVVAPDTSLSPPTACFLSFSFFFFPTSPSRSLLGWLSQPSSLVAAPPPLGAAARPSSRRLAEQGLREGKARRLARSLSDCQPCGRAARAPGCRYSRSPRRPSRRGGCVGVPRTTPAAASSPVHRRSPAMVAARTPAL